MTKKLIILFWIILASNAHSNVIRTNIFTSLKDPLKTIDLKTAKLTKATFIAHDCKACHQLLKTLVKKCSTLNVTTFAVGNRKNLKSKLRMLNKLKSRVYMGSTTEAFSEIGIDLMPYYISSNGKKYESDVLDAMINDSVCKGKN